MPGAKSLPIRDTKALQTAINVGDKPSFQPLLALIFRMYETFENFRNFGARFDQWKASAPSQVS
jgi:hypothetical protein